MLICLFYKIIYVDASSHLYNLQYKRPCPSVGPSVGRSVTLSSKSMKNGLLWILSDRDSAGRGRKRNKEEGGTRRKEGRGGRSDEEEGVTRRKERQGERKNEKIVKK